MNPRLTDSRHDDHLFYNHSPSTSIIPFQESCSQIEVLPWKSSCEEAVLPLFSQSKCCLAFAPLAFVLPIKVLSCSATFQVQPVRLFFLSKSSRYDKGRAQQRADGFSVLRLVLQGRLLLENNRRDVVLRPLCLLGSVGALLTGGRGGLMEEKPFLQCIRRTSAQLGCELRRSGSSWTQSHTRSTINEMLTEFL